MNKKVSKTLAAVLSAAMAASAFAVSTGAAFAAPNVSATIAPEEVGITSAATGSYSYTLPTTKDELSQWANNVTLTVDGKEVTPASVTITPKPNKDWVSQNSNLAVEKDGKIELIQGKNISQRQDVTFTREVSITATVEDGDHTPSTVTVGSAQIELTVAIYPDGYYFVVPRYVYDFTNGEVVDSEYTMGINQTLSVDTVAVNTLMTASGNDKVGEVHWDYQGYKATSSQITNEEYTSSNSNIKITSGAVSGNGESGSTVVGTVAAQDPSNVHTGETTISVKTGTYGLTDGKTVVPTNKVQPLTVNVEDYIQIGKSTSTYNDVTIDGSTWQAQGTDYTAKGQEQYGQADWTKVVASNGNSGYTVGPNTEIKISPLYLGTFTVDSKATVNDITADDGYVKAQGADGQITINGTAGDVTAKSASVTVGSATNGYDATVGNVEAKTVTINGDQNATTAGEYDDVTVGDVKGDAINVNAYDATYNGQTVGAGDVTVGDITINDKTNAKLTLKAGKSVNTMTLGTISGEQGPFEDCPYGAQLSVTSGTFDLGDLNYIGNVSIGDEANVTAGAIDTGNVDSTAAAGTEQVKSAAQVNVGRDAVLTVSSLKTATLGSGTGTIIAPAGGVEVTAPTGTSNMTMIMPDAEEGAALYRSTKNIGGGLFKMPGVTTVVGQEAGENVYVYSAETLAFQGIQLDKTSLSVGQADETLTLSMVPQSTTLPEGVTVQWSADKDSVELTPSADGLSCTIKAVGYTAQNINGSNNVTVRAPLYKDGEIYTGLWPYLSSATCNVTLTDKAPEAEPFTVKVTDLNGNTTTCAADGSTVIEVPQSTSFRVEMTSGTSFPESQLDYHAANGDVAGTNTISAWNGTSGVYEVYAAGGVGEQASMWANGQRIFQIRVTSRPFTSDTTMDFDLKVGNTYTFAINPNNKNASFTFNTANGDALQTSIVRGAYPDANGIYYCKVKATQAAGKIGVYCTLDGVLYKVFTVNTIA